MIMTTHLKQFLEKYKNDVGKYKIIDSENSICIKWDKSTFRKQEIAEITVPYFTGNDVLLYKPKTLVVLVLDIFKDRSVQFRKKGCWSIKFKPIKVNENGKHQIDKMVWRIQLDHIVNMHQLPDYKTLEIMLDISQ